MRARGVQVGAEARSARACVNRGGGSGLYSVGANFLARAGLVSFLLLSFSVESYLVGRAGIFLAYKNGRAKNVLPFFLLL